jgi:hypothetical protein
MNSMLILFGGTVAFLVVFAVALGLWHPRSGIQIVGRSLRNHEAEAEIEAHDIDQMIDARNDLRRRIGKPELGEELAKQLEPHLRDG